MTRMQKLLQWLDDKTHPVAIRDMRRAVQNRFVFMGLLLIIMGIVVVCLIGIATNNSNYAERGNDLFSTIYCCTGGIMVLLIPLYLCLRVGDDLSDKNNLVEISTLRPLGRTWGFFTVGFILMFLVASIALPYLMFCYMLGGMDLPTIFLKWLAIFILALPAMMGGIFVGTLTSIKPLRLIFTLAYAGGLLFFYIFLVNEWMEHIRATRIQEEEWIVFSTFSFFAFVWLYMLAAARMASTVSNRVLPLRILATVSFVVLYIIGIAYLLITRQIDFIMLWFFISFFSLAIMFLIAICEREEPGLRVRRSIPKKMVLSHNGLAALFRFCRRNTLVRNKRVPADIFI